MDETTEELGVARRTQIMNQLTAVNWKEYARKKRECVQDYMESILHAQNSAFTRSGAAVPVGKAFDNLVSELPFSARSPYLLLRCPGDRLKLGAIEVVRSFRIKNQKRDLDQGPLYTCPAFFKSSTARSKKEGNPARNQSKRFGDFPIGAYLVLEGIVQQSEFGHVPPLILIPVPLHLALGVTTVPYFSYVDKYGLAFWCHYMRPCNYTDRRDLIRIHGDYRVARTLQAMYRATHGCGRVKNKHMADLNVLRRNHSIQLAIAVEVA